jgi:hypothetical protein|tara:strand:- start:213 stop:494 length:282 start_codon:yes stop_codon:yes gene_type:complete
MYTGRCDCNLAFLVSGVLCMGGLFIISPYISPLGWPGWLRVLIGIGAILTMMVLGVILSLIEDYFFYLIELRIWKMKHKESNRPAADGGTVEQ